MKTQNYTPVRPSTALTWDELSLREQEIQDLGPKMPAIPVLNGVYADPTDDEVLYAAASRAYASAKRFKRVWEGVEEEKGFWVYDPEKGARSDKS